MRTAVLGAGLAVMLAISAPAFADCLEDVESLELAALQAEGEPAIDDPSRTPAEKGRATMDKRVSDHLREAEAAARHGDEMQCFAMYQTALRILSGF